MFLFHVDAEPLRSQNYPPGHVPFVKALVLVNHHDPEQARRLVVVALADDAWLLRTIGRIDVLTGRPTVCLDDELQPLIENALRNGVAIKFDS